MIREYEMLQSEGGHESELTVIWLPGDTPADVVEGLLSALSNQRGSSVIPLSSMSHALWLQSGEGNRRAASLMAALGTSFAPSTPCYISGIDIETTFPQSVQEWGPGRLFLQEPSVASITVQLRLVYRQPEVARTATQMLGRGEPRIRRLVFTIAEDVVYGLDTENRRMLENISISPYIGATIRELQRASVWFTRYVIEAAGGEDGRYGDWVVTSMDTEFDHMRLVRSIMVEIARPDYARERQALRRSPPPINPTEDAGRLSDLFAGAPTNLPVTFDLAAPTTDSWNALRNAVLGPVTGRYSAATPPPPAEPPAPPPLPKLPGNRIIKLPKP